MIVVTGPTGGGKTIFGGMFAEELAESWQVAFYVCTELTKWQMMWRRISRRTGIPFEKLSDGYWDERSTEILRLTHNGGRIDYFEAGGQPLSQILAQARRRKAHLILE